MAELSLNNLIKFVPDFSGQPEEVFRFLEACSDATSLCSDVQKPVLFKFIKSKIRGNATIALMNNDFTTWEQLKEKLISIYSDKKNLNQLMQELHQLKQYPNETVICFGQRTETAIRKILEQIRLENSEMKINERRAQSEFIMKLGLTSFCNGLRPQLSTFIRTQNCKELNDAIKLAQGEELSLNIYKYTPSNRPYIPLEYSNKNVVRHVNNVVIKCYNCGKMGHISKDCRQPRTNHSTYHNNNYNFRDDNVRNGNVRNNNVNGNDRRNSFHVNQNRNPFNNNLNQTPRVNMCQMTLEDSTISAQQEM